METYAKILLIATPAFLILVILEKAYGFFVKKDNVRILDVVSSLNSGITNSVKDVLGLSISIISYGWLERKFGYFKIENTFLVYFIAFMVLDFQGYWVHRFSHTINIFWNKHAIHHSSEEFDLACALRQSISSFVNLFTFFLLPAAFLGVPQEVIAVVAPLHLFAQFWYHTIYIDKMGFLEKIIVTPSHHRVHHALNREYLDKNLGQIFIFWDMLFGTYQPELQNVKPVYGISRPANTWNPIKINFQHLFLLISDAWRTSNYLEKLTIWFKPTGWRPEGFEEKFPVQKIDDPYTYQKFKTNLDFQEKAWVVVQFLFGLGLMSVLYFNIAKLSVPILFGAAIFIFLHVYILSDFMDQRPNWYIFELIKNISAIALISQLGLSDSLFSGLANIKMAVIFLFIFFSIIALYFKFSKYKSLI
jgi:alkylglycerol monooxygenase